MTARRDLARALTVLAAGLLMLAAGIQLGKDGGAR